MKMSVSKLREMIARIVREEVDRAVQESIHRHLPEALAREYIGQIVAESLGRAPQRPAPPAPVRRQQAAPAAKSIVSELVRKHGLFDDDGGADDDLPQSSPLLDRSNPLRGIYEGTEPLPAEDSRQPGDFDVPLDQVGFADASVLKRMAGI